MTKFQNFLLVVFLLLFTGSGFKQQEKVDCCKGEKVSTANKLVFQDFYTPNCDSILCYNVTGSDDMICKIEFSLFTESISMRFIYRAGNISRDSLSRALDQLLQVKTTSGNYVYIAGYAIDGRCYRNTGALSVVKAN